jgi:hypothetical protein
MTASTDPPAKFAVDGWRRYRLFGLRVDVRPALPHLRDEEADGPADVRVWMGCVPEEVFPSGEPEDPWYVSPRVGTDREPTVVVHRRAGGAFRLRYADGCEYVVDAAGTAVACTWPPHYTAEDGATYLLGPVMALVLRMRGVPALHAGAVAMDGRAVALVGPAGAGKSTTTAALARRGHAVLADDVLALRLAGGAVLAQPAYPHLRLWPGAVPIALGAHTELPPLTPNWEKRLMRVDDTFQRRGLPLAAVYVLAGRRATADAPGLEPLPGVEGILALVGNAYLGWFPDRAASAREVEVFGRVAAAVPVVRAIPHADGGRLGELCALIEADVRGRA